MNYQPRQIKFRVWDDSYKKMWYKDSVNNDGNEVMLSFFKGGIGWGLYDNGGLGHRHVSGVYPENGLMQFTGLTDKVGSAIYEGDVLLSASGKEKYKVIWHHSGWFEKSIKGHQKIISLYVASKKQVIIGNIFAHPELITT